MNLKKALFLGLGAVVVSTSIMSCGGEKSSGEASGKSSAKKREITVISREESSGTRGAFDELMKITDGKTNMLFAEAVIVSSTDESASKVEVDKNAVGYTSLGSVNDKVKAVSIDGVAATEANVKNGTYNISRPFVLAMKSADNNKAAKDFVAFTQSTEGQAVVAKRGYVTIDGAADYKAASGLSGKITLSGSTSVERVIEQLKEAYIALNPGVQIEINYNGSSAGIKDCLSSKSDIAMSSRALKPEEKEQMFDATFALDGIAVIVNRANAVDNLTADAVTRIFKGEVRHWEDL